LFTILNPIQSLPLQFLIKSPVVCSPCIPLGLPNSDFALPSNPGPPKALSTYCNAAGTGWLYGSILSRNQGGGGTDVPPFRLAGIPPTMDVDCARMRVGRSGRGIWWDGRSDVYRCNTVSIVTSEGSEYRTFDTGLQSSTPLCTLPEILRDHYGDWALDFDEGTGRIVYCDGAGLVSIIDVVHDST